eukprot:Colp12_sorted_trinity150504_noHs@6107
MNAHVQYAITKGYEENSHEGEEEVENAPVSRTAIATFLMSLSFSKTEMVVAVGTLVGFCYPAPIFPLYIASAFFVHCHFSLFVFDEFIFNKLDLMELELSSVHPS